MPSSESSSSEVVGTEGAEVPAGDVVTAGLPAPSAAPQFDEAAGDPASPGTPEVVEPEADPVLDDVSAAAVDLARAAAVEEAGTVAVGEHLGVVAERGGLTLHTFACLSPGYRGWAWAVSLARPGEQPEPTVCEVVLLPHTDAVLAPTWLPWSDRLAPGDLGAGDELPYRADDPNLVPGYTVTDEDDEDQQLFWELGLGRVRVLGPEGARDAARRWRSGDGGPQAEVAVHAAAACRSCGYFLPVSGLLRRDFGVCANEWSPSDGKAVTVDHGCGAHSETDQQVQLPDPLPPVVLDENLLEQVDLSALPAEPAELTEPVDQVEDTDEVLPVEEVATVDVVEELAPVEELVPADEPGPTTGS